MKKIAIISASLAVGAGTAQIAVADEMFDLAKLTCFEVASLPEDDSLFVTALLIGHLMGQNGTTESTTELIRSSVEGFDQICGENPDMPAIDAVASNM